MLNFSKSKIVSIIIGLSVGLASCTKEPAKESPIVGSIDKIVPITFATWDGLGSEAIQPIVARSNNEINFLNALAACDCAPALTAHVFSQSAITPGVLPQVLVPKIRQRIANDGSLAMLNDLPPGLSSLMSSLFANDQKIYTSVRDGIQESIGRSLAPIGGSTISMRLPYRLDLFTTSTVAPLGYPVAFDIAPQAARWNLVMSTNAMWKLNAPVDGFDHGLQLLETMRVAAEWAYLAGIGGSGTPDGFGGLATNVTDGPLKMSKPINPELAPDDWAIFTSGRYSISYPYASSVDLATRIKESWIPEANNVGLEEQATIWRAAALAFSKLRSDRLGPATSIFADPEGALDSSVGKLPLIWLPAMGMMLEKKFINAETQTIHEFAYPQDGTNRPASLKSLLTAAQALHEWRMATLDIDKTNHSESIRKRLATVPQDLVLPLQLITRTILSKFTTIQEDSAGFWVAANREDGTIENDPAIIAEMVVTLGLLEQSALNAPELKDRLMSLYQWHVRKNLAGIAGGKLVLEIDSLLWNVRAAEVMSQYSDAPAWITNLRDNLRTTAKNWRP